MEQPISKSAQINLSAISSSHIDVNNKTLTGIADLLKQLGYTDELDAVSGSLPALVNSGVDQASEGVIQDPAGSAVGSGVAPIGGGASGAIYSRFPHLEPVPGIEQTQAVFNSTEGEGGRVLHSFSPHLTGSPQQPADCTNALNKLANAYFNAFLCEKLIPPAPGVTEKFKEFAAVPLAGKIFAHDFKNSDLEHLHPGYTVAAMLIAQAEMLRAGKVMPKVYLYYFDKPVYREAIAVMDALHNDLCD